MHLTFALLLSFGCVTHLYALTAVPQKSNYLKIKYSLLTIHMVTVEEAEKIISAQTNNYGTESVYFENALGRVLAEDIKADRDLPPYNRVTMDGIAITFA